MAQLDGCAAYVEWVRGKQQLWSIVFVIVVERDLDKKTAIWLRLMKIGAATGCHQMYKRSFSIFGYQFPLCARCTGLGIGQITGLVFSFVFLKYNTTTLFVFALISIFLLGIDGLGQYYQKWESTNIRRLITGLLCGFLVVIFIIKLCFELLKAINNYYCLKT